MDVWQNIKTSNSHGFTLVELLAAVAIVGVIATLALPRYRAQVARSRQAEAKSNLGTIRKLQKTYYYDGKMGEYHSGLHYGLDKCGETLSAKLNGLGFRLTDCSKSRYRYITNAGNDCAKSDGNLDQGKVYPGCMANDEWHMSSTGRLTNTHDVIKSCPNGASSPSSSCVVVALPAPPTPPAPSPTPPTLLSPPIVTPPPPPPVVNPPPPVVNLPPSVVNPTPPPVTPPPVVNPPPPPPAPAPPPVVNPSPPSGGGCQVFPTQVIGSCSRAVSGERDGGRSCTIPVRRCQSCPGQNNGQTYCWDTYETCYGC